MRARPTLFAFAFALAAAPPASAGTPVTVNVPVEFKNLNAAVTHVGVSCRLTGKDPVTLVERRFDETQSLRITGGTYTGPSPLTFTFRTRVLSQPEIDALNAATAGSCEFVLVTQNGTDKPTAGDARPAFAQKPGTPFQQKVTFTFP